MIVIIGAGPIGCFLGGLLAKKGKNVAIYEKKAEIGKPIQCTGIITPEIKKILNLKKEFIANKTSKIKIFSKNQKLTLPVNDIVINREKFDKYLAKKAKKNGAKIYLNHKYLGIRNNNAVVADKDNKIQELESEYIIGADGPLSEVAKSNKMFGKREFYFGVQARIKGNYDLGLYQVYLGSLCKDFFAWIVPESEKVARVGIASRKDSKDKFNKFLKNKNILKKNIIEHQAGLIPIFDKKIKVNEENIYLVGDAAAQLKATTGGGLVPGLKGAKILADCLVNKKDYKKELKKLNRKLKLHLKIRQVLNNFSDKDYNDLLKKLNNPKIKQIMNKYSRDNPKKLILGILLKKPSVLKYTTKFIN